MTENPYSVLGLDQSATDEEIREAFKSQAKKNHTDVGGDNNKMVAINKAYGVLKDKKKKEHFDRTGQQEIDGFDKKFQTIIQDILVKIIAQVDVDHTDILHILKENLKGLLSNGEQMKDNAEKEINKFNKVLERLSANEENKISQVIQLNLVRLEQQIGLIDEDIKFVTDCLEVLNSYHYKFDEKESGFSHGRHMGSFSFSV